MRAFSIGLILVLLFALTFCSSVADRPGNIQLAQVKAAKGSGGARHQHIIHIGI